MKKNKNYNLYILAILAILAILFILFMGITIKETLAMKYDTISYPPDFRPTQIEKNNITNIEQVVMYKPDTEYKKNDMPDMPIQNTSYASCLNTCVSNPKCRGIVTDFEKSEEKGRCWLKQSMNEEAREYTTGRYSTILNRVIK